jgi:putative transcriptional regulator
MSIRVNLDVMLARRKRKANQLAQEIGITEQNLSVLRAGHARAIRFSTLDAICAALACQPGDILEYVPAAMETPTTDDVGATLLEKGVPNQHNYHAPPAGRMS